MANKRMFSQAITDSARFLKMPHETQAAYFHLCMRADDDGVVEAFTVLRLTGLAEDNLKILAAKNFVVVLNEDLVTYITDWNSHNNIRADRKIDSVYQDLLIKIIPDVNIVKPKKRADTGKPTQARNVTTGRPVDGIDKISIYNTSNISKDILLGKEEKKIKKEEFGNENVNDFIKGIKKVLQFELSEYDRKLISNMVKLCSKHKSNGEVKKDRDWLHENWKVNANNFFLWYKQKRIDKGYTPTNTRKVYENFKLWFNNKGNI